MQNFMVRSVRIMLHFLLCWWNRDFSKKRFLLHKLKKLGQAFESKKCHHFSICIITWQPWPNFMRQKMVLSKYLNAKHKWAGSQLQITHTTWCVGWQQIIFAGQFFCVQQLYWIRALMDLAFPSSCTVVCLERPSCSPNRILNSRQDLNLLSFKKLFYSSVLNLEWRHEGSKNILNTSTLRDINYDK